MSLSRSFLFVPLLAAVTAANADGASSFTIRNQEFVLKSAYARSCPDPFDASKQSTEILFSGRAFDEKAIAASDDPAAALDAALDQYFPDKENRPTKVEIIIARAPADGPILSIDYSIPGESSSASVNSARYTIDLKRHDDSRIEGSVRSKDAADKNARFGGYFDLKFALDVHPGDGC